MREILRRRERMGLTQEQLAPWLDVSPETLCRWETGTHQPRRPHLEALAKVFNCTVADLFSEGA